MGGERTIALTAAQHALWLAQRLDDACPFTVALYVDVEGPLDRERLRTAMKIAGAESGVNHARIVIVDDEPRITIDARATVPLDVIDLRDADDPAVAAQQWMRAEYTAPVDVDGTNLYHSALLRIADDHHLLYLRSHHIVLDGYGAFTLINRIAAIYSADDPPPSTTPSIDAMARVEEIERTYAESPRAARDLDYWTEQLAGADGASSWSPTPAAPAAHPTITDLPWTFDDSDRIDAAALIAAIALYQARITDARETIVGVPVSGRTTAFLRSTGGSLAGVVPIRVRIRDDDTIGDLITEVRTTLTAALRHQRFVGWDAILGAGRSASGALYTTLVNVMPFVQPVEFGEVRAPIHILTSGPVDDLSVNFYAGAPTTPMHVAIQWNPQRHNLSDIRRHGDRLCRVTSALLTADRDRRVGDVAVLGTLELDDLTHRLGGPAGPARTLPEIIVSAVAAAPDAPAVVDGEVVLTYRDVDTASNHLARDLAARGAGPETIVAVALPRSARLIVTLWAVAKTGAAFLPVDPHHPRDRLEFILTQTGATIGVARRDDLAELPRRGFWLTDEPTASTGGGPVGTTIDPRTAAYVIYTSGSTGRPKGVVVPHTGLAGFIDGHRARASAGTERRILAVSAPTFDASIAELLLALAFSAPLVISPPEIYAGPDLAALIARTEVTHAFLTPRILASMDPATVPDLRVVMSVGDTCPPQVVTDWSPGRTFVNDYGPSEATIWASGTPPLHPHSQLSIGRPVPGSLATVLDSRLRPVGVGVVGELWLSGPLVARGYCGRADLTAERFVADPFGTPGDRMYRTGDLVYWTSNGELVHRGRSDFQIKIRGQRVEPGDVESVLLSRREITSAVVVRVADEAGERIVAYVTARNPDRLDVDAVLADVADRLPDVMVPAQIVVLDAMPLGTHGKVDRGVLPAPTPRAPRHATPTDPVESVIADAVSRVIGTDRGVGADDDFFTLGGDSISAITLSSILRDRGVVLRPRDVFAHRTIGRMARAVGRRASGPDAELPELPGGGVGRMPLTPVVSYVLAERGDLDRFVQVMPVEVPGDTSREHLAAALGAVIRTHDMLRAALVPVGEEEWQLSALPADGPDAIDPDALITEIRLAADASADELTDRVRTELDRVVGRLKPSAGVDLSVLWVARTPSEETVAPSPPGRIVLVAHHIAIDAVSWRIVLGDLMTAAALARSGAPIRLAPTGTSMRRWAYALGGLSARGASADEADHWRTVLSTPDPPLGLRGFDAALDHVRVSLTHEITLDLPDTQAVTVHAPRRYRAGVDDVLAATLAVAVAIWRSRRGVETTATLLQAEGHGRDESLVPGADLTRTVGWFTAVHPTVIDLTDVDLANAAAGGHDLTVAIKAAKQSRVDTPHQGIGYGLLRYPVGDDQTSPAIPDVTPQIGLNYLGRIGAREISRASIDGWLPHPDIGDLTWRVPPDTPALRPVDIDAIVLDGRLRIRLTYPTTLLTPLDIRELGTIWSGLLESIRGLLVTDRSAGDTTPADFGLVAVTQADIDGWEQRFGPLTDVWPLTPVQSGLTFHALTAGSFDAYVVASVIELTGTVDLARLHRATEALLARHDPLRTAFLPSSDGEIVGVVVESATASWRVVDLSTRTDPEAAFTGLMDYERSTPFDPAHPPLVRFVAVTTAPDVTKLLVVQHHMLLDGWSMPIVLRDLLLLYRDDAVSGEPPPPSFSDYLAWRTRQDVTAARAAWTEAFTGSVGPTLIAPSAGGSSAPAALNDELRRDIGTELSTRLAGTAGEMGVTLATLAQLAWAVTVSTVVESRDVTIGATVSGRPADLDDVESMVGLFINTVPMRVRFRDDDTLATAARRLQDEQTALLDHQFLGLTDIRSAAGDAALFDTTIAVETYPLDTAEIATVAGDLGGAQVSAYDAVDATHHPVGIAVVPGDSIVVRMTYRTDAVDETTASTLLERYTRILSAVADERDTAIVDLILSDDRDLPRRTETGTFGPPATDTTLIEVFAAQAARTPDVIALTHGGRSCTYRELDDRSAKLARLLRATGVGIESPVAVALDRSIELFVAVYAVLRAGGVYVPVDPATPASRIGELLESAAPGVIITSSQWSAPLAAAADFRRTHHSAPTIIAMDDPDVTARLDALSAGPITDGDRCRPDNLAYLIHTSGSTGRPKGVGISHRAITNHLAWRTERLRIDAADIVLHKTPISFDVSMWELFAPLQVGARVVIADPGAHADPIKLAQIIAAHRVTIAHFVPTVLGAFLAEDAATACTSLRHVIASGEALPAQIARDVHRHLDARLHNFYGPTETAVDITAYEVIASATTSGPPPIGTAVWNCEALLLDQRLRPVPVGMSGEIYLAGVQLARGYHRQPALTADRFVAHPYGAPGERLYRTGDIGRRDASGNLHFLGRRDLQVSLHGLRIELAEIEAAVCTDPEVAQCVATVRDDRIVAYAQATPGRIAHPALIRSSVAKLLPAYMIPSAVIVVEQFPVTASGKLDRAALPAPGRVERPRTAPSTPAQRIVAAALSEVLGHIDVNVDDDLHSLGGNSISAMRIAGRLTATTGTDITIRDVVEANSVAELARRVDEQATTDRSRIRLVPGDRPLCPPLSAAQSRMWLANRRDTDTDGYLMPIALRITGDLDIDALQIAIDTLVDTHETLRTCYPTDDSGTPYQLVRPAGTAPQVHIEDLTGAQEPMLADVVAHETIRGFDLTDEVPLRVRLLALADREHLLLLVFHHIAVDGSSFAVLAEDLVTAYRSAGVLPARRVQYVDYARWQREVLGDRDDPTSRLARSLTFWQRRLADAPDILDLPVDRARSAEQIPSTGTARRTVPDRTMAGVAALADQHRTTAFTVWHTAFAVALARWTGADDIVVATPVSGRDDPALESLIGMFVNTVPIRTVVDSAATFTDLLADADRAIVADLDHRDTPYEDIVEHLNPTRTEGFSPLSQVLLAFQNHDAAELRAPGIEIEHLDLATIVGPLADPTETTEFALSAEVSDTVITLRYARHLFDENTIDRFGRILDHVLRAATENPTIPVGDLPTLSADEYRRLTTRRGRGDLQPCTLPDLLARTVALRPHDIALSDDQRSLTWWQLDRFTNRLARMLLEHGAAPETTVAVAIPRSIDHVLALWAVAKTGAAFLPLDPQQPVERLTTILDDAAVSLGVTATLHRSTVEDCGPGDGERPRRWLTLDDPALLATLRGRDDSEIGDTDRHTRLRPENTAYVIYTSGSTGSPKGVLVTHQGLHNAFGELVDRERGRHTSVRLCAVAATTFDAALYEVLICLATRGAMIVAPPDISAGPELAALLANQQITHLVMTPQSWASIDPHGLDTLRYAVTAGEQCPPALVTTWAQDRAVYNDYGPTESTIWATSAGPLVPSDPITVGSPIRGIRALVLDTRLHPVPVGTPGELYLAGPQLARGYVARHGLTAERFVANPFGTRGERMYRTGDLVRWSTAGDLVYLGRNDHQVKLRGLRIEVGEIESVLAEHPDVERAAVVLHTDPTGDHIIAYVRPAPGRHATPELITEAVAQRLPRYMVPSQVIAVDEFPVTATGKLDRRALPAPVFAPRARVAPMSPTEVVVADTVAEVLAIATSVGLDDDFFALGGTSLSATRLTARLGETLGVHVGLRTVFDARSIGALARALHTEGDATGHPAPAGPKAGERPARLPLSSAQQRMWFLDRFDEASGATAIPIVVRVGADLDVTALRAALLDVIDRHEILRTVYSEDADGVYASILPGAMCDDLLEVATETVAASDLPERIRSVVARPVDLAHDLPIRVTVLTPTAEDASPAEVTATDQVVVIALHHIAADGWSIEPLSRDLLVAYRSRVHGQAPDLTPLPMQYADYALWQHRTWATADEPHSPAAQELDWWRDQLAGLPAALDPPTLRARPSQPTLAAGHLTVSIDDEITDALRELARGHRVTPYLVLHAAMAATLAKWSGATDVAIGTPVAGRGAADLDDLVGVFINTVVIRTAVAPDATFTELLTTTRDAALGAFAHAALPFDQLVDRMGIERTAARHPLVQNMLTLRQSHGATDDLNDLGLSTVDVVTPTTPFDLVLELIDDGSRISGVIRYGADIYTAAETESFRSAFTRTLAAVVSTPAIPVGDIDILGSDLRRRLLNQYGPDPLPPRTLSDLLDDAMSAHPDRTAIIGTDLSAVERTYSYRRFHACAQNLARELIAAGVGPEQHVAIALPRSPEYMLAVWAVTTAGGAFLPIDPDLPPARIARIIDDAAPVAGLTTRQFTHALPVATRWLCLDDPETSTAIEEGPGHPVTDEERLAPLYADNTAYIIYTSGSTGEPKAVVTNHTGLWDNLVHYSQTLRADDDTRVLAVSAPTFDAHVAEILIALASSAPLVIAPPTAFAGAALQEVIARHRVTHIEMTPRVLDTLDPAELPSVSTVISVGEACGPSVVRRWSHVALHNDFGPSEATVRSSGAGPLGPDDLITVGVPGRGVGVLILDRTLQPTAPGVSGEMYLTGEHLARGYLHRPGLTADRFVADPHGAPGERMYRTGDLACWSADGRIVHLGRVDNQVKVRGIRIELGEIEAAILTDRSVADAIVVVDSYAATESDDGTRAHPAGEHLVAYITVNGADGAFDARELGDRLKRDLALHLPRYMVPTHVVVLESFPITSAGKVDRRALPAPAVGPEKIRPPVSASERQITAVFGDLLDVEAPGIDDDFFRLGGNSLLATQLMARLEASSGIRMPIRTVFDASTVGNLAAALDAAALDAGGFGDVADAAVPDDAKADNAAVAVDAVVDDALVDDAGAVDRDELAAAPAEAADALDEGAEVDAPPIVDELAVYDRPTDDDLPLWRPTAAPRADQIPLSFAQRRIWFLNRLNPRGRAHLIPMALSIEGPLRVDMLRTAIADVIARHEVLRTIYPDVDGVGRQQIVPPADAQVELSTAEIAAPDPRQLRGAIMRAIDDLCASGLDVTTDLPIRLRLLTINATEHVLVVVLHHIAADGWSMAPLTADLLTAYHARCRTREPFPTPLLVQFADHALAQQDFLGDPARPGSVLADQSAYWRRRLSGIPEALDLPTDRPRIAQPSFTHAAVDRTVDADAAAALTSIALGHRATVFMVATAALAATLAGWTGTDDVVIGTPVAGRGEEQLDRMVGMFVNTIALRTRVDPSITFAELLTHARTEILDDLANAELPLERVVDIVDPLRTTAHHPLFQVILAFQNHAAPSFIAGDLTVDPIDLGGVVSSEFDLAVSVDDSRDDGTLPIRFDYATDLFDSTTIERLADRFLRLLAVVADRPTTLIGEAIAEAALPSPPETDPATSDTALEPMILTDLIAMPDGDPFGTRVNQIARMLVSYGVGPELPVVVVLGPSLLASVAIHAIVAAGGAWVPVDPDTPADRIEQVITVSGAVLGISTTELAERLPASFAWMFLDDPAVLDVADTMAGEPVTDDDRRAPIRPQTLACIQAVPGTLTAHGDTGNHPPELVETTHAALAHRFRWLTADLALTEDDVILHGAPLSSPESVDELFLGPVGGACTVIAENGEIRDPVVLNELIADTGVTIARLASTMVASMNLAAAPSLRRITTGGEPLTAVDADRIIRRTPAALTHSHATAATGVFFTHDVAARRARGTAPSTTRSTPGWVPIGGAATQGVVRILDARLRPVPAGVAGELYVSGPQLARGFSNESAITSTRFVADPFVPNGSRLYRTGDLVRRRADGAIEYLGRADGPLRLRGVRVDLGVVESVLAGAPGVRRAAAVLRDVRDDVELIGYVDLAPGPHGTAEVGVDSRVNALRSHLADVLPQYLVPDQFVVVNRWHLDEHGALDRSRLPEPSRGPLVHRDPMTDSELLVARAIKDILSADVAIGLDDTFFALGGTSLSALQLVARLREWSAGPVPVDSLLRLVLTDPTVEVLARGMDVRATQFRHSGDGSTASGEIPIRTARPAPDTASGRPAEEPRPGRTGTDTAKTTNGTHPAADVSGPPEKGGVTSNGHVTDAPTSEPTIDPALTESLAAAVGAPIIRLDDAATPDATKGEPVFFIHPILGLSWPYVELAGYLASDHPVYGVQTPAFAEPSFAPRSFVSLVGRYTDEITRVNATGPYHLVGWSVGGTLAQAIAVELRIRGLDVASLVLIDPLHSTDENSPIRIAQNESVFSAVGGRREDLTDADVLAIWQSMGGDVFPLSDVDATRITRAMLNIHQLSASHHPFVFDGITLAVDSAQTVEEFGRASDSWRTTCPRVVDVHTIDAPHGALMTSDAVAEIGPILRDWLRALAGGPRR